MINTKIKKFFWLYATFVVVGMALVAGLNYYYDPAHVIGKGQYEQGIADILLSGNNAANVENLNYRVLQKYYFSHLKEKKDVIAIGSSRSMQVRSTLFPGKSFYNSSMTVTTLEDCLAIYYLMEQYNVTPSTLVLGLDPWVLTGDPQKTEWRTLQDEYFSMLNKLGLNYDYSYTSATGLITRMGINVFAISELVSLRYTGESFARLFSGEGRIDYYAVADQESMDEGLLKDGSRLYPPDVRNPNPEKVEALARKELAGLIAQVEHSTTHIDNRLVDMLEKFMQYLQAKDIRVVIYLPPLHPTIYKTITQYSGDMTVETEIKLREIAKSYNITVIGSYDPGVLSITNADFLDATHTKEIAAEKAFASLDY